SSDVCSSDLIALEKNGHGLEYDLVDLDHREIRTPRGNGVGERLQLALGQLGIGAIGQRDIDERQIVRFRPGLSHELRRIGIRSAQYTTHPAERTNPQGCGIQIFPTAFSRGVIAVAFGGVGGMRWRLCRLESRRTRPIPPSSLR